MSSLLHIGNINQATAATVKATSESKVPDHKAIAIKVEAKIKVDDSVSAIEDFFKKHKCPKPYYAREYVDAANRYNLPLALLPAISIVESSCGLHYRYNNFWGWNSAKTGFKTVPEGIDFVSQQLATGGYYKGKSLIGKLSTYNSVNPNYGAGVIKLMNEIKTND